MPKPTTKPASKSTPKSRAEYFKIRRKKEREAEAAEHAKKAELGSFITQIIALGRDFLAAYERRIDALIAGTETSASTLGLPHIVTSASRNGSEPGWAAQPPPLAVVRNPAGMGVRLDPAHPDFMDDPNGHSSTAAFRDLEEVARFRDKLQADLPPDVFEREKLLFNKYRGPEFSDEETNQYHRAQLTRLGYPIPFDNPPVAYVGFPEPGA